MPVQNLKIKIKTFKLETFQKVFVIKVLHKILFVIFYQFEISKGLLCEL